MFLANAGGYPTCSHDKGHTWSDRFRNTVKRNPATVQIYIEATKQYAELLQADTMRGQGHTEGPGATSTASAANASGLSGAASTAGTPTSNMQAAGWASASMPWQARPTRDVYAPCSLGSRPPNFTGVARGYDTRPRSPCRCTLGHNYLAGSGLGTFTNAIAVRDRSCGLDDAGNLRPPQFWATRLLALRTTR